MVFCSRSDYLWTFRVINNNYVYVIKNKILKKMPVRLLPCLPHCYMMKYNIAVNFVWWNEHSVCKWMTVLISIFNFQLWIVRIFKFSPILVWKIMRWVKNTERNVSCNIHCFTREMWNWQRILMKFYNQEYSTYV